MIRLDSLSKSFGGQTLFQDLNWQVSVGRKIGLVGPNGAGKTTLFRIIAGHEEADSGAVIVPRGVNIGYLPQELVNNDHGQLLEIIMRGRNDLLAMESRLRELEALLSMSPADEAVQVSDEYGTLQEKFRREGGYTFRSRARELAVGVGFSTDDFEKPIETFSGGWQVRALLCRLLLQNPSILLLDEPTNHLDLESIEWLESYLSNYEGTVIIVSHDRYFLNRLIDEVAELAHSTITIYQGNYDAHLKQREQRREQQVAKAEQQQKEIEKMERFVERFRAKATKATQAQSRVKQLEKIERIEVLPDNTSQISFEFAQPPRSGKIVMRATGLSKAFGDNVVYDELDFELLRGDKVAIVGPNGAGKSTLLKMLAGKLQPDSGTIEVGHHVELTYFAQHAVDQLDMTRSVLDEMQANASFDAAPRVRGILGAFLFRGDDVNKPISVLSGGEKSRLALAKMLLEPAGCLLLDEPTNHLDIPSCQMLEHALKHYQGAFCVISHDRYFLNEIVNKVVHIEHGKLKVYEGSYDYYKYKYSQEMAALSNEASNTTNPVDDTVDLGGVSRKEQRRISAELRKRRSEETGALRKQLAEYEEKIAQLEVELDELQKTLAAPETYETSTDIGELHQRYGEVEQKLEALMMQWEELGAEIDAIDQRYAEEEARLLGSD